MPKTSLPTPTKFPAAKQKRLDALLDKNSEGTITPREKVTLEKLVEEVEQLTIANGKLLAEYAERTRIPSTAVPVTVWVDVAEAQR